MFISFNPREKEPLDSQQQAGCSRSSLLVLCWHWPKGCREKRKKCEGGEPRYRGLFRPQYALLRLSRRRVQGLTRFESLNLLCHRRTNYPALKTPPHSPQPTPSSRTVYVPYQHRCVWSLFFLSTKRISLYSLQTPWGPAFLHTRHDGCCSTSLSA